MQMRRLPSGVVIGILATVVFAVFASPRFAGAEEKKEPTEKTRGEMVRGAHELESITVTAQKQEENIREVPISITVLDGLDIEDRRIDGFWKLADHVPGLMNTDIGMSDVFAQPSMRGITASPNSFSTSVGLYVDGVPVVSSPGYTANLLDIERVEVLRGPQGTLYGKNAEAGAINIITRQPDDEWRGTTGIEYGEDNKRLALGTVSGPLARDRLYFSLSGQYEAKDGFLESTYLGGTDDDRKRYYGRGQMRWTPAPNWDISLILSRLTLDEGGSPQVANPAMRSSYGLPALPDRTTQSDFRPVRDSHNDIQALKIAWDVNDAMRLTSITSRKMTDWYAAADFDFSSTNIYHVYNDSEYSNISQEIRVNWQTGRLKGLVGVYGDKHLNDIDMGRLQSDGSGTSTTRRELGGDSYAVFGQVDYSLTRALHVIAGLRYEKQNMDYKDGLLLVDTDESWNKFTPKLSLQYRLSPGVNVYATVAQGFRTGGFNHTTTDLEYRTYDPEELWSYEVGVKTSLLGNRLILNAGIYYMDIEDMQVEEGIDPMTTYITNAAEATARGGEIELTARLARGLTVTAGLAYNDTTFDTFKDALGDYSGNENPYAPDYNYNLGANYRLESGLFLSADLTGYGDMFIDKSNRNKVGAYELVNAKIGWEFERFDAYLYATNLFDTQYDIRNFFGYYNTYSPPRETGLRVNCRF